MSAPTTGCSGEGAARVKAGEDTVEAASIAAPAKAAIAPRDRMRKTMVTSGVPNLPKIVRAPSELGVNGLWRLSFRRRRFLGLTEANREIKTLLSARNVFQAGAP
jgi:hypothetical protein